MYGPRYRLERRKGEMQLMSAGPEALRDFAQGQAQQHGSAVSYMVVEISIQ